MSCDPGADAFIQDHFGDCVYNVRDYIGFFLGLAAIAFWLVAQLPQYYQNYKTKSADALSPWFLAQWLLGDTFNLIGALLQGQQLPTTVYTAMYFVIADMFMMMQFIYYGALQRRRETVLKLQARRRQHHHTRRHHHHRDAGSSRERESLISHHPADGPPAADGAQAQQEPQQQQGQSSAWGPQQQERRRVPHQGATLTTSHQAKKSLHEPAESLGCTEASPQQHFCHHAEQQGQQRQECHICSSQDADAACSCSGDDSDSSTASMHSSSKGPKPLSRGTSPSSRFCDKAGGASIGPASCAAAAAAALSASQRGPYIRQPLGQLHWGGVRSVVAVAVLVSMGLVSLLPASTTRGLVPISLGPGPSAAVLHAPHDGGATARAMQAGQQLQGSSIHLSNPQLLDSLVGSAEAGSSAGGSGMGGSSSSSSGSRSQGWARQRRVGDDAPEHSWSFIVGTGLGYVASILYLCSRISQIHKNYSRKSSEGLALVMFMMAVCANLCTGTSIVVRTFTWVELKEQLPWIIGSLGTISLDMVILWQSNMYSKDGGHQGAAAAAAAVQSLRRQHHQHHHHHHAHERQGGLQPGEQQQPHMAVDIEGAAVGRATSGDADTLLTSGTAVLDSMPVAPHHRGALLGRRHS